MRERKLTIYTQNGNILDIHKGDDFVIKKVNNELIVQYLEKDIIYTYGNMPYVLVEKC